MKLLSVNYWRFFGARNAICRRLGPQLSHRNAVRRFSHEAKPSVSEEPSATFTPFLEVLKFRRQEAGRSILVQVQSAQSYKQLYSYCSSLGTVKQMLHYTTGMEDAMNFIVVEFANEAEVQHVLKAASHTDSANIVPVQSQFLWFSAANGKLPKLKQSKEAVLNVENGTAIPADDLVQTLLRDCDSVSSQIEALYDSTKLNDISTRLRFLTTKQAESVVKGMFPNVCALPFGSSVNGCGKMGCDLDIVLELAEERLVNNKARLIYHCKETTGVDRNTLQRHMETIGDLIDRFLPGCSQVRRILQARVPIIKYRQQFTGVECDLTLSNMSGVHMSDFLYVMGSIDARVRPLIFAVRKWAHEVGLTNNSPGKWITNFSLTLLVLAFLQKPLHSPPVLPSLNALVRLSKDKHVTSDGVDCSFLRDVSQLKYSQQNSESLETLLKEFFEYYAQFDFGSKAICVNEAVSITKPEHCPLYIVNPLERGLNVSKNVGIEEVENLKNEAKNAAWRLESQSSASENWGFLSVLVNKRKSVIQHSVLYNRKSDGRLVNVSELFESEGEDGNGAENDVEYKNSSVKKQVAGVKKDYSRTLSEIQKLNR